MSRGLLVLIIHDLPLMKIKNCSKPCIKMFIFYCGQKKQSA